MNEQDERRAAAVDRLTRKREFGNHALMYCAINLLLVVVWAASGGGFSWPIWVIADRPYVLLNPRLTPWSPPTLSPHPRRFGERISTS